MTNETTASQKKTDAIGGAEQWSADEICDACVKAGLGILECNSLMVTLKGSIKAAPTVSTITLTGHQLIQALDLLAPGLPRDPEELDGDLTFGVVRHESDDGKAAVGMCCWNDDTDGVLPLDEHPDPALPIQASTCVGCEGRPASGNSPCGVCGDSATIQAAPDESQWVDRCSYDAQVDEWAIERSNLEADAAAANRKSLEFKRVSDEQRLQIARLEIALQRAATIQEPVMVAEPGLRNSAGARKHAERIDNMHKGVVSVFAAIKAEHEAAPMVADPAGVAVQNLELVIARLEQIAGNFTDDYRNAAEEALVCARSLAATVKAVPSEAVGEGQAQTSAAFPLMRAAFETSESGPNGYFIKFKFPTLVAMQKAHIEWIAAQLADSSSLAAPMVADPAGVAGFTLVAEVVNERKDDDGNPAGFQIVSSSTVDFDLEHLPHGTKLYTLAATVKAVPSEAVDEVGIRNAALEDAAKMLLNGYFLHDAAPPKLFAGEAAKAIREMKIVAPLAGKTGGGE